VRFGDLTYQEIREQASLGALAVIPTGCTEQQGPHLPVDFDTWFAETLCLAAAKKAAQLYGLNVLILPVLPFGPTPEHRNFGSGYIDLPQPVHQAVISAVLTSLTDQGFQRLVIWRGCGGHNLSQVAAEFNRLQPEQIKVIILDFPYHALFSTNCSRQMTD
jgi:creatinine amidohydrolase